MLLTNFNCQLTIYYFIMYHTPEKSFFPPSPPIDAVLLQKTKALRTNLLSANSISNNYKKSQYQIRNSPEVKSPLKEQMKSQRSQRCSYFAKEVPIKRPYQVIMDYNLNRKSSYQNYFNKQSQDFLQKKAMQSKAQQKRDSLFKRQRNQCKQCGRVLILLKHCEFCKFRKVGSMIPLIRRQNKQQLGKPECANLQFNIFLRQQNMFGNKFYKSFYEEKFGSSHSNKWRQSNRSLQRIK